jgi:hypothetical protein
VFVADELQRGLAGTVNELSVRAQRLIHDVKAPGLATVTGGPVQGTHSIKSEQELTGLVEELRSALREGEIVVSWRRKP